MQPEYYFEVHYGIPSLTMPETLHWYVLCDGDVLKFVHGGSSIPSRKFDSESDAQQAITCTDISTLASKIVACEDEF